MVQLFKINKNFKIVCSRRKLNLRLVFTKVTVLKTTEFGLVKKITQSINQKMIRLKRKILSIDQYSLLFGNAMVFRDELKSIIPPKACFAHSTRFADSQNSFAVKLEKCRTTSFANTFIPMTSRN